MGLISTKPVRAGCLSEEEERLNNIFAQAQRTMRVQTLVKKMQIHLFELLDLFVFSCVYA